MPFRMFTHIRSCNTVMSSSFNDVTFWKVNLEIFKHILSCITVMSSSFNDVTYWNVRLVRWRTPSSVHVTIHFTLSICHSRIWTFTHILSCNTVMSSSFNDVTFWKVYLESSNLFFQVLWCHHPSMMSHTGTLG